MILFRTLLAVLLLSMSMSMSAGLWACDDDAKTKTDTVVEDTTDTNVEDTNVEDTNVEDTNVEDTNVVDTNVGEDSNVGEDTTAEDTTTEDTTTDDTNGGTLPPSDLSVSSCSETPSQTKCDKHADCGASDRCENVSDSSIEVPCCVAGPRGTDPPGTPCDTDYLCDTGFCVARGDGPSYCSNTCVDNDDCAAPIGDCVILPFIADMWCVTPDAE